mmetsp:Transcript_2105/g.7281  ORF Transcript_2105/g.7281 Transcript_2105/m.7281 type:complete len:226 (+) Transcript_2105:1685-2362(+)
MNAAFVLTGPFLLTNPGWFEFGTGFPIGTNSALTFSSASIRSLSTWAMTLSRLDGRSDAISLKTKLGSAYFSVTVSLFFCFCRSTAISSTVGPRRFVPTGTGFALNFATGGSSGNAGRGRDGRSANGSGTVAVRIFFVDFSFLVCLDSFARFLPPSSLTLESSPISSSCLEALRCRAPSSSPLSSLELTSPPNPSTCCLNFLSNNSPSSRYKSTPPSTFSTHAAS